MKAAARGGLRNLGDQGIGIAVERALQCRAGFEGLAKLRGFHPQGRSCSLHDGANGRGVDPLRHRKSDHAFTADQSDLQTHAVLDQSEQRNQQALVGKVDVLNQLPRFMEHVPKRERDEFEAGP